ncbi:MAG: hypothetical protein ACFFDT_35650 [Candidatus Hodarchaeota archaeon]
MLALWKLTDPELDREACIIVHTLQIRAEGVVSEEGRPNLMDGSECNDGENHSGDYLDNEVVGKSWPVPAVLFI